MFAGITFGAGVSLNGGKSFNWICEDAMGGPSSSDASVVVTRSGVLVALNPTGIHSSHDNGCTWGVVGDFNASSSATSIYVDPNDPNYWRVTANRVHGFKGSVLHSTDGGKTFATVLDAEENTYLFSAVALANRQTWLVVGTNNAGHDSCILYRSQDGGANWAHGPVAGAPAAASQATLAVHPTNAAILLLAVLDLATQKNVVLRSVDGGTTFTEVGRVGGDLRGLFFNADGSRAWASGTDHIITSDDGGQSFRALSGPAANACVLVSGQDVYACGNSNRDGFALARRVANAWQGLFTLPSLQGPYHCAVGTPTADLCTPAWAAEAGIIGAAVQPVVDTGQDGPNAGPQKGGCHCTVADAPLAAGCLVLWGLTRRVGGRRRRPLGFARSGLDSRRVGGRRRRP